MAFNLVNTDNVSDDATLHLTQGYGPTSAVVDGTIYLFSPGYDEGISVFSVGANGTLANVANVSDNATTQLAGIRAVTTGVAGGTTYLYVAGYLDDGISEFSVGPNGALTNVANVSDNATLELAGAHSLTTAVVGGTTYLFAGGRDDGGISAFSVGANGVLTNVANVSDNQSLKLHGIGAVTTAVVGGTTYLFAASIYDSGISVFSVGADGALTNVANVSDNATLNLNYAHAVTTAQVGGTTYLFVGAYGDQGVSAFSVGADGSLTNVANVKDNVTLHLAKNTSLATVTLGGTTYLLTGGYGDGGVSAFAIGAGGSLTNVLNVDDNPTLELTGAYVATGTVGAVSYVFAQGTWDNGVSVFRVVDEIPSPVAKDDRFGTAENAVVNGAANVFANNGAGPDDDPNNNPFAVTAVNGSAAAVGHQITLPSSAHVTLDANGDLDYDPNHAFDSLPAPGSGASNTKAVDTFTYAITGGDTATVTVTITGVNSDDILRDTPGIDHLAGGAGNDTYFVRQVADKVVENPGKGADQINSYVTFTLGANVENLRLLGRPTDGAGNGLDNVIIGNAAANRLKGLAAMICSTVRPAMISSTVRPAGYPEWRGRQRHLRSRQRHRHHNRRQWHRHHHLDRHRSLTTFANIESELLGGSNIAGTGNALGNTIVGNAAANRLEGLGGNDILDGAAGKDILSGGVGNDTYVLGNSTDTIIDVSGIDTITSTVTRSLTTFANIEKLTLLGGSNIAGTGNALDNIIVGNAGVNVLDGRGGADTMSGLAGNDTYFVNMPDDVIVEAANAGSDVVRASDTYILTPGASVEGLTTTDPAGLNLMTLVGNHVAQTIVGNNAINVLTGLGGNDQLQGQGGNDTLNGGAGADKFVFNTTLNAATNVDTINDFTVVDDVIRLDDAIFTQAGAVGALAADAFHIGAAAADAEDRIIYNSASGDLFYNSNGTLAGGSTLFAHLKSGLALTNADFAVI